MSPSWVQQGSEGHFRSACQGRTKTTTGFHYVKVMSFEVQVTPAKGCGSAGDTGMWRVLAKNQQYGWVTVRSSIPSHPGHALGVSRCDGSPGSAGGENQFPRGLRQPGLEKHVPRGLVVGPSTAKLTPTKFIGCFSEQSLFVGIQLVN